MSWKDYHPDAKKGKSRGKRDLSRPIQPPTPEGQYGPNEPNSPPTARKRREPSKPGLPDPGEEMPHVPVIRQPTPPRRSNPGTGTTIQATRRQLHPSLNRKDEFSHI